MGVRASQIIKGAKAAAEPTTLSGIAIVTTATAISNPQFSVSVVVDKDLVGSTVQTISESVQVTVT